MNSPDGYWRGTPKYLVNHKYEISSLGMFNTFLLKMGIEFVLHVYLQVLMRACMSLFLKSLSIGAVLADTHARTHAQRPVLREQMPSSDRHQADTWHTSIRTCRQSIQTCEINKCF